MGKTMKSKFLAYLAILPFISLSYTISAEEIETTTPNPGSGFNSTDGYGHTDASKAFEQLLDITLPNAPILGENLWALDNLNVPEVWNGTSSFSGTKGTGSTIAVIDTGVDLDHPEFTGRITAGYDFVDNDSIADDGDGHGTHVAGIVASMENGEGTVGVAPDAKVMSIKFFGNGVWTSTKVLNSYVYARVIFPRFPDGADASVFKS